MGVSVAIPNYAVYLKLEIMLSYWCFVNEKACQSLFRCYSVISGTETLKLYNCFL